METAQSRFSFSFGKYFQGLDQRGRMVLFQLPLFGTMLLVVILAGIFRPVLLQSEAFLYSLGAHLLLLAACAVVPWDKLPARSWVAIPADAYLAVVGFLLVFPVVWLSIGRHRSGVVVAVASTIVSSVLPPMVLGTGFTGPSFIRVVLLPVIIGAISLTAFIVATEMTRQRRQLERQDTAMQELLAAGGKREQLLETIMDTVGVGVYAVDGDGRKILANRQQNQHMSSALAFDEEGLGGEGVVLYGVDGKHQLPCDQHPLQRAAGGETFTDELIWLGAGADQRAYSMTCRRILDGAGNSTGARTRLRKPRMEVSGVRSSWDTLASKDNNMLSCEVRDNGTGMTEEEQAQAFTRFYRAARAHSSNVPGAGLGLPITKAIIEQHGGTVALASAPGEGVTVTMTLPADPEDLAAA